MTECQGCGAWNDTSRALCVLCGTPLAETDEWEATAELPPLPPLPDGGLRSSMPDWLREPPRTEDGGRRTEDGSRTEVAKSRSREVERILAGQPALSSSVYHPPPSGPRPPSSDPLGARADPRTFLTDDDFPRWLRDLAAREVHTPTPAAPPRTNAWPDWPASPAVTMPDDVPHDGRALAAATAARAADEPRPRAPWETLLLAILFLGVVAAALWALVSNGVFSPGL